MTAILTGLRHGELNALPWPMLNLKRGTLRKSIADRMSKKQGERMLERPKTKNAFRRLDLPGDGGITNHFSEAIGEGGDWIFGVSFGKIAAAVSQQLSSFVQVLDRLSVT